MMEATTGSVATPDPAAPSEGYYRLLFETMAEDSPDMISRHAPDGRYLYVSGACRSLLGYEPEELVGVDPHERMHPDDVEEVRRLHAGVPTQPGVCTVSYRFRSKDGSYRWLESTIRKVLDATGEVVEIQEVSRDVGRRKRAEEALRASEDRLRTLISSLPVILFVLDESGVFTMSEGRGLETLGLNPGQVVGLSAFEVYRAHPQIIASVRRALAGGTETSMAEVGKSVFVVRYSPLRRPDGSVDGVIGVATDVTEQRRTEEQLRLLSEAVKQSPASVVITDPNGIIEYVNPQFERVTGYSLAEVVGRRPNVLKSGQMAPAFYRELWETIRAGREWRGEFHNQRRSGELFWEAAVITPIKGDDGQITHLLAVKEDVTERKQAEATRARLEAQLRESQKLEAFGQLAGGVAHDFNNILTVIQSHACLLQEGVLTAPEGAESVREIARSAERAANLTAQLLAFSRRQVMQPRELNANDVLANMTRMLQRLIGEHITLEARYAPGTVPVLADGGMLEQVILNLAVNARDAMPRGGRLSLFTEAVAVSPAEAARRRGGRPGTFVCLGVTDTGGGIPEEILPRIFEPFFTTKEVGKGTGLGLSTVLGIVEQHSGWVDVRTEPGRGTTFLVYLPRLDHEVKVQERSPVAIDVRRGSETILVVEDEPPLRMLVRTILERQGYRVLEAGSGPEALRVWEQHRPRIQLLLTDMVMPEGLTGVELAERLWEEDKGLKIVFTTGYSDDVRETHFLRSGTRFLPKPYDPAKLTRIVRECLDGE